MPKLPIVDTWGSTLEERKGTYHCDHLIEDPDLVLFRAVDIAASTEIVFAWLCQLRVAPYSYDWIDNFWPAKSTHAGPRLAGPQRRPTIHVHLRAPCI